MRAVVQRSLEASVVVDGETVGRIPHGLVVLLGVEDGDTDTDLEYICKKVEGLRIFTDPDGKMNLSVSDVQGEILLISQFTLCGDVRHGRRPSFTDAAAPETAKALYEKAAETLSQRGIHVETGIFQADMKVHLINDGPVTIMLDSRKRF